MSVGFAILTEVRATFVAMAPYLLLGLACAGVLHVLFSRELVIRHLGSNSLASVIKAAILGVPLPLCSCGVVPTALALRKSCASRGAVMSFLISTPQTGVDSIVATWGMLGPVFAVFRPLAALLMGVMGGIAQVLVERKDQPEPVAAAGGAQCPVCDDTAAHSHSLWQRLRAMVRYGFGSFLDDISVQLVVGIAVAGLIAYLVPDDFFVKYVSNDLVGMLLMVAVGIPMYVCATASIPIAMALMMKGLSAGAAFVFLCAGPATNAATIVLVAHALGRRFVSVYLATMVIGSIVMGFCLNFFFGLYGGDMAGMDHSHQHVMAEGGVLHSVWVGLFAAALALSLMRKWTPGLYGWLLRLVRGKAAPAAAAEQGGVRFGVEGMTCSHCAAHVRQAMLEVPGVRSARVDLAGRTAVFDGSAALADVKAAVVKAGYRPV